MNNKHFLDTSVLRPILTSPRKVKIYYSEKIKGKKYICDYVKMEFLRGYIQSSIDFYFLLAMPQYTTFSDALNVWSNKFSIREHKNIEIMVADLLRLRGVIDDSKEKSLNTLADYIRRLIGKLKHEFIQIGTDNTYCQKAKVKLDFKPDSIDESFLNFLNGIRDNTSSNKCKIEAFLKLKHKEDIEKLIAKADKTVNLGNRSGFDTLINELNIIDSKNITCTLCSKLGDVIISFLSPPEMILEHTDFSFNYLCDILGKPHNIHPYDGIIMDR